MRPTVRLLSLFVVAGWFAGLGAGEAAAARPIRAAVGPYQLQVLSGGVPIRSIRSRGETWVLGQLGERYTLRITNRSDRRIEAVVSVDGRDVIDGRPGDYGSKRGYLVPAGGSVDIDGWRISNVEAAAFRFSAVADSYAARTGSGRDVGVIGVAIFPERAVPRPVYVPRPRRYAPYPEEEDGGYGGQRDGDEYGAETSPSHGRGAGRDSAAPAPAPSAAAGESALAPRRRERPGLGTEFGEAVSSQVREVEFVRAAPSRPAAILGVRYNDRDGLLALGIEVDEPRYDYGPVSDSELRETAEPFPVSDRRYATPPPGWRR